MEVQNGEIITDGSEQILDSMVADAAEYFETTFNDSEKSAVKLFYAPIANEFSELQEESSIILESTQIDNAEGASLDLLCSLIGVNRQQAVPAEGEVTFERSEPSDIRDYSIPRKTIVQTTGDEPITFETTESATLEQGNTEVTVPIEAIDSGEQSNISSDIIDEYRGNIAGIESVTNRSPTQGGSDQEEDDELRERAKNSLAEGSAATANALLTSVINIPNVKNVQIFRNDGEMGDMPGWEMVVHGGNKNDIAQTISEKMAAGETPYSGNYGESVQAHAELVNGQSWPIEFSRPEEIEIYIEADITTEESYEGVEAIKDSIVDYIGGIRTTGNTTTGDISVSDDVIYGEIEYAIRDIEGVYDISTLEIGTADPPESTSNINIEDHQAATIDANENIDITSE